MPDCFLKWLHHFTVPSNNVWGFRFLHILTNACYCLFFIIIILVGVKWYFTVVLIYIFLINDEHIFMCLLAISIAFLVKCLFKSFVLPSFLEDNFAWYAILDLYLFYPNICNTLFHFLLASIAVVEDWLSVLLSFLSR